MRCPKEGSKATGWKNINHRPISVPHISRKSVYCSKLVVTCTRTRHVAFLGKVQVNNSDSLYLLQESLLLTSGGNRQPALLTKWDIVPRSIDNSRSYLEIAGNKWRSFSSTRTVGLPVTHMSSSWNLKQHYTRHTTMGRNNRYRRPKRLLLFLDYGPFESKASRPFTPIILEALYSQV